MGPRQTHGDAVVDARLGRGASGSSCQDAGFGGGASAANRQDPARQDVGSWLSPELAGLAPQATPMQETVRDWFASTASQVSLSLFPRDCQGQFLGGSALTTFSL